MIPDDPIIHFGRVDVGITNAAIRGSRITNATERLRLRLKRLKKRLYEVPPPQDWRPLGYEW